MIFLNTFVTIISLCFLNFGAVCLNICFNHFQLKTQISKVQSKLSSSLHRSSSSPAIIRIPASSLQKHGESPLQGQIKLQTSQMQSNSSGGPRIIKITRLGGQTSSTIKVPVQGNTIPLSGIINKTTGGIPSVKLGNIITKSSTVPTINLNDFSGRTSATEVPISNAPKSAPESINWSNLVQKDPNTGACTINLANLATASGKKIIITTTNNQVTVGGVSHSVDIGAQVLSSAAGASSQMSANLGGVRLTPSSALLQRSETISNQSVRLHSGGIGSVKLDSMSSCAINAAQSPSVSLLQGNPALHHSVSTPVLSELEQHHSANGLNGSIQPNFKANVTHKDLSRLWSNEDVKLKKVGPSVQQV